MLNVLRCPGCMCGLSHGSVQILAEVAAFPSELYRDRTRAIALCDILTRSFGAAVSSAGAGALLPCYPAATCKLGWPLPCPNPVPAFYQSLRLPLL